MRQFTVKDFISYCNPCPLCGRILRFALMSEACDDIEAHDILRINPSLVENNLEVILKISYRSKLILWINPVSNEFSTTNFSLFIDYISKNNLFLYKDCKCYKTTLSSKKLEFGNNRIKPINIMLETFSIIHEKKEYMLITDYESNESSLEYGHESVIFPLLPYYKIGTKENLIKKIKMILLLS